MDTTTKLLTLPRAARRFGLTTAWLRAEAEAGRLPCLRAGRRQLFDADALERTLLARAAADDGAQDARP